MSVTSEQYCELAAADRAAAAATNLPRVRERLLLSAERWEQMAERQQSVDLNRRDR
jgi:anti-sigma factor ChrR (cupin superfamily)